MPIPVEENSLGSTSGAAATSLSVSKVTGVVAGDLLLILLANDPLDIAVDEFNTPTGWNKFLWDGSAFSDTHVVGYWREASGDSGDDAPSITWTTTAEAVAWYIRVSGANVTTPIHVQATPTQDGNTTEKTVAEIETTIPDCLVIYFLGFDGGDGMPFSVAGTGWSQSDERQYDTAGNSVSACYGTKNQASAGFTADAVVTTTVADNSIHLQFAIAAASAGPDIPVFHRHYQSMKS